MKLRGGRRRDSWDLTALLNAADPRAPRNRRISIVVMNREAEERALRGGAPEPDVQPPPRGSSQTDGLR